MCIYSFYISPLVQNRDNFSSAFNLDFKTKIVHITKEGDRYGQFNMHTPPQTNMHGAIHFQGNLH